MFYHVVTDKGCGRSEDAMEEKVSSDNSRCSAVKYGCAQNREVGSPERGILMPSEGDLARAIEKISRLSNAQFEWFIHQMRHLGFSPYGEMSQNPAQQSK